ncbi:MAG TPA: hypothetical protein VFS09_06070 [Candidatus Eisenbacteria bacterium]|nr:hypothetical protein [Candidatus Eisenbacteria bacterium]
MVCVVVVVVVVVVVAAGGGATVLSAGVPGVCANEGATIEKIAAIERAAPTAVLAFK